MSLDPAMAALAARTAAAWRSEQDQDAQPPSSPACRFGEDEEDEDWPPTNTLRAMRLCPRCERPMVDHLVTRHGLGGDLEPRPVVVTDEEIVLRAAPATWDGLRCFEARALLRLATAEGDTVLAAHCSRGIKAGCMAKDSLRAIAEAINERAKGRAR